jgi:hypothetical protein
MKMNWSKVVLGGIAAGIVMEVIDFLSQKFWLHARSAAEMDAFKPGLSASMEQTSGLVAYLLLDLLFGIILVWLYAAIRPRFGPGPATAVKAAVAVWLVMGIAYYGYLQMGMFSSGLWWSFSIVGLINLVVAALVGAKLYSEDAVA